MNGAWIDGLHRELLRLRTPGPAWGNRSGGASYVEPTALAALALAASTPTTDADASRRAVASAADWLKDLQQVDGSLGISPDLPRPCWTTPLAILVWIATDRHHDSRRKAVDWLLAQQGTTWAPTGESPYGHDPRIAGWSWVEKTHSWLEPTAHAVLALRRAGLPSHARTRDGERLIRDRAIRTGGWNYGNSAVFGTDLQPQPAPTGLALLALSGVEDADGPIVTLGCDYLESILPTTRAPLSLCYGVLALAAWGRRPSNSDEWLAAAHDRAARSSNCIPQLAYLLLAAGTRSLELLGSPPITPESP
ncbi:MAG: hypothetical protein HY290_01250 [Planctomycetia bacterium]|nr:hypothetical protein [Planctomycetia bacterium]